MWSFPPISQPCWIFLCSCEVPCYYITVLFLCGLPDFLHWRLVGLSSSREGHDYENKKRRCSSDLGSHGGLDKEKHGQSWDLLKVKITPLLDWIAVECEKERGDQGATNFSFWLLSLEGSGCHSMRLGRTGRKIKSLVLIRWCTF